MSNKFISWTIFILLCFIWGSSFILMKVSKEGLTAPQIAGLRIFSAGLVLTPFALVHLRKVPRKSIGQIFLAGIFGNLLPAFLFATAITRIDSGLTGILNSLTPICVVCFGILMYKDKIGSAKIVGVLVGFAGLCLLTFTHRNISLHNIGFALLVILATMSYGLNTSMVSHRLQAVRPFHIASISLLFMTVPAGLLLWQQHFFALDLSDAVIQWSVINSLLLGIVGSAIATALFYMLVQRAGGLFASLVTYGIPFVALMWGFLDGEAISIFTVGCLVLILLGVFLANRPARNIASTSQDERVAK